MDKEPKVSIGLPVFNGEQFLEKAITSILAQTFTDFELIISDNASTDRTSEICKAYQAGDPRIRYHRNEINIGAGQNYNLTFQLSRGMYFCFSAHDDIYDPQFFEKCVEALDKDSTVALSHSIVAAIDESGNILRLVNRDAGTFATPHERFRALASFGHNCEDVCGLIRSDVLRKTNLLLNYTDSDRTLLAEIGLYGRFERIPETLFYKRIHQKMSTMEFPDPYARMAWFNPKTKDRISFPNWQQFFHYIWIIAKAPIGIAEKIKCYQHIPHWLIREWHGGMMARDIKIAVKKVLGIGIR